MDQKDLQFSFPTLRLHTIILMPTINPWINFNGNAEEAFTFYKSVFGGEFKKVTRFKDLASPEFPVAEKDANKIMQIALLINDARSQEPTF